MSNEISDFLEKGKEELNKLKSNIIDWYEFDKTESVLEIGYCSETTLSILCQKFKRVVLIEKNLRDFFKISKLQEKYKNLELLNSLPNNNEKFDYILLINCLNSSEDDIILVEYLTNIKNMLDENGKVLIAVSNKFGGKEIVKKTFKGFSKERISQVIKNSKFDFFKFYYVLPSIDMVNVIFSDEYLPTQNDIRRNMSFALNKTNEGVLENQFFKESLSDSNEDFKNCANAFFIEISKTEIDDKIKAVYYNNIRPEKYRLRTKIFDDIAIKENLLDEGKEHISNIKNNIEILKKCNIKILDNYDEKSIISTLSKQGERLDDKIVQTCKNNLLQCLKLIKEYENQVLTKLSYCSNENNAFEKYKVDISNEKLTQLTFIKNGFWDLTFQNVFLFENEFWVYDQEWYEENIPVEFILFRSINSLEGISYEEKENLFNKLNIANYKEEFQNLESEIQKELTNYSVFDLYKNTLYEENTEIKIKNTENRECEFQNKLIRSKDLVNTELEKQIRLLKYNCNKLNSVSNRNVELEKVINSNTVKTALRLKTVMDPILPLCKQTIKLSKKIVKLTLKLVKIPARLAYQRLPKKLKRKLKLKVQYSRKLSKIIGIPRFTQYGSTKLYSVKDNSYTDICVLPIMNKSIGIHLHLYYEDLLNEFYAYLSNMPYKFDLYVSIKKGANKRKIKSKLRKILNLNYIEVVEAENCGRDFGPMFVLFAKKLDQYDYIMHIHSKKSLRMGNEQSDWRRYLLDNLLGTSEIIMKSFYMMENCNIGLVYPDTHVSVPSWAHTWLDERALANKILNDLGIEFEDRYLEFSAGSMFWAKKDALKQMLELKLSWEDFGKEKKQTGGTLEYVFERLPGILTRKNGYSIAIYNKTENVYLLNKGEKNLVNYFSYDINTTLNELLKYDVISFDIFDTLITRKIFNPDDIFYLIEKRLKDKNILIDDYFSKRKNAESSVRKNKNFVGDCSIDEIYDEFSCIYNVPKETTDLIKSLEFQTELDLCIPRRDSLEIYKRILNAGKKIVLISDMYLTKAMLEKLLNNCGYYNYFELLVSSEVGARKDNGTIWTYFYDKYKNCRVIHVGDNEEADMHKPVDLGKSVFYLMQGKKMFRESNYNQEKKLNLYESIMMGCIINKSMFNSPYAMHNIKNEAIIKSEKEYGYSIVGPIIFEYLLWAIKSVLNSNKKEVLLFASREGYYLQKIYHYIVQKLGIKNIIEDYYLLISRRAITVATIEKAEDIYELMREPFRGTLREVLYHRLGFEYNETDDIINLPQDFKIVKNIIDLNLNDILEHAKNERILYLKYISELIEDIDNKELNFLDLGYSGTAQYYLSLLLKKKINGKYFAVSPKQKPLSIGCKVESCYNKNIFDYLEINTNPIFRYSIALEGFLTAPQGQFKCFINEGSCSVATFNYDDNKDKIEQLDLIYLGIIEYIDDIMEIVGDDVLNLNIDRNILINNYRNFVNECNKLDVNMKKLFNVEDYYCSNGIINGIDLIGIFKQSE